MSRELPLFLIDAGELLQHVSRVVYRGSPLYYGRSGTNRYDDPARTYGVLYLGRDLSTRLGKEVRLRTVGEGTELDKGLIEKIADPLVDLVRI